MQEKTTLDKVKEDKQVTSTFFYREWRALLEEKPLFLVHGKYDQAIMGKVLGFVNYEHAVVEIIEEAQRLLVIDLTGPNVTLFKNFKTTLTYFDKELDKQKE